MSCWHSGGVTTELIVPTRFRGPARSGNGGWTAGALAETLGAQGAVRVTLWRPPALETTYTVTDGIASLDGEVMGQAEAVEDSLELVEPVAADEAREAMSRYPGLVSHPFPTCFSCGTDRAEGEGLRIFPGQVADTSRGRTRVAATWTPHPAIGSTVPVTWAALDCPGGWAGDVGARLMVLGRITARLDALPEIGVEHVVVAEERGTAGRKTSTAATLYDAEGRVIGTAEHVWIAIDPADFN
jgi:hypothetical protein